MSSNLVTVQSQQSKRHYGTNHNGFIKDFPVGSQLRNAKLKSLKEKLLIQSSAMKMITKETDLTAEAGWRGNSSRRILQSCFYFTFQQQEIAKNY